MRKRSPRRFEPRCGFTLIELLVSISIIALLMSLLMPAIQKSRESARLLQCKNRTRNLTVALIGYHDGQRRFPAAGYWGLPKTAPTPNRNWVVELLPWLDRQDLADRWDKSVAYNVSPNAELAESFLEVLVCPSDITTNGGGDLSYAVNGGIGESAPLGGVEDCPVDPFFHALDLNGNGIVCAAVGVPDGTPTDREIFKKLGMFFSENVGFSGSPGYKGTKRHHSIDSIMDGASNTLLLTENVRVGYDPFSAAGSSNWASPRTTASRVFFSYRVCASNVCAAGNVDYSLANHGDHAINAALLQPEGEAPWPSSNHSGGVNMAFSDGHVRFIDENIDGRVYASLFSPQGRLLTTTPLDQGIIDSNF